VVTWAQAEEKKPEHSVSFNASLTTDYRYRGISQTRLKPALQGGVDYSHNPSGFYAGAWASNVKWIKDANGDTDIEFDFYGGKKGEVTKDVSYDVGILTYVFPSNKLNPSANTTEVYGQLGFGPAYVKYSYSTTNVFGFADSKRSGYFDLGANFDMGGGYTLNTHVGRQTVRKNSAFSYTDYKLGVTKDFGVATVALALIHTNTDVYVGGGGKNLGKTGGVLSISKTF
jgi:uncharacterized protein (TIGR02001 family)